MIISSFEQKQRNLMSYSLQQLINGKVAKILASSVSEEESIKVYRVTGYCKKKRETIEFYDELAKYVKMEIHWKQTLVFAGIISVWLLHDEWIFVKQFCNVKIEKLPTWWYEFHMSFDIQPS